MRDVRHGGGQQQVPGHRPGAGGPGDGQQDQAHRPPPRHAGDPGDSGDGCQLGRSSGGFCDSRYGGDILMEKSINFIYVFYLGGGGASVIYVIMLYRFLAGEPHLNFNGQVFLEFFCG